MSGERITDSRIVNPAVGTPWRLGPWLTAANVLVGLILVVGASSDLWTFWFSEQCAGACVPPADWVEAVGLVGWLALGLALIFRMLRAAFGRVER